MAALAGMAGGGETTDCDKSHSTPLSPWASKEESIYLAAAFLQAGRSSEEQLSTCRVYVLWGFLVVKGQGGSSRV